RRNKLGDRIVGALTSALIATPDLLIALGLLVLAIRSRMFPVGGIASVDAELHGREAFLDIARHFLLPTLALSLATLPILLRHTRTGMIVALASPSVEAARAFGIPRFRILFRYALPAAANPIITLLGFSIATLISDSLLVEVVMSWPGLGPLLLEAIFA